MFGDSEAWGKLVKPDLLQSILAIYWVKGSFEVNNGKIVTPWDLVPPKRASAWVTITRSTLLDESFEFISRYLPANS